MLFSVPRVMFGAAAPGQALKESFQATLANIGAYIVFAIVYIILSIIAAIPLGLGFLILIPVIAGAVYHANREVFGDESTGPAAAAEPAGPRPDRTSRSNPLPHRDGPRARPRPAGWETRAAAGPVPALPGR
ncbi:MAG: hypothetical protein U5K43_05995 [Halofilum sp. (in: g-proteobacteria)]|nr:hypothetical protein [Halofilum sp. (in: g-proteobacteria)]